MKIANREVTELKMPTRDPKAKSSKRNCLLVPTFFNEMWKGSSWVKLRASAAEGDGGVGGRSATKKAGMMETTERMAINRTLLTIVAGLLSSVIIGMIN